MPVRWYGLVMPMVDVTREIGIPATPEVVWSVLATPSQQPVLEPRVRLVSEWGTPGTVGSGYELAMRGRPAMRLSVTQAIEGDIHAVAIELKGRRRGSQMARLRADGSGSVLTYTVSYDVPRLMSGIQRAYCNRQLARWLESVARVCTAADAEQ